MKFELVTAPITTRQLVQYAGASGDFNRIHYDEPFAKEGGFPSVIAHGMLSMAFFGRALEKIGTVQHLKVRFRAVTFPGDTVTIRGEITAISDGVAEVSLSACRSDGTVTLEGSARITPNPSAGAHAASS
jgi:acyl dehydratase